MTVFRCKMCNANIAIGDGKTIVKCEYCGTEQTVPVIYDDKKEQLYDRASHARSMSDFDKAKTIYEEILLIDPADAECYWQMVLCDFGIEYVIDERTQKHVPTINRMQYTSILANENYLMAIRYADEGQKQIYERQAKEIETIQQGVMEIVSKEEPYDVFICYKETDQNGRRTQDSVLANELYHELTKVGYRVFYSRITLEDKLGVEYEPYIFAALQSAKIMVVLGTKPEYFEAVWVKNEWSRFLTLMEKGEKKQLIPAYKNMNPYDLPTQFRTLHCMDMEELGFVQELIRGLKKILGAKNDEPLRTVQISPKIGETADQLMEKVKILLEDEQWEVADNVCEDVLNQDAYYGEAYFYHLMIAYRCKTFDEVKKTILQKLKVVTAKKQVEPDRKELDEIVKQYTIQDRISPKEIRECFNYNINYTVYEFPATVEDVLGVKQKRFLERAIKYSEKEASETYKTIFEEIEKTYSELETQIKENEKKAFEEYLLFWEKAKSNVIERYRKERQIMQEEFEEAKKLFKKQGTVEEIEDYRTFIMQYKDCEGFEELQMLIDQRKQTVIIKEKSKFGVFKKRAKDMLYVTGVFCLLCSIQILVAFLIVSAYL